MSGLPGVDYVLNGMSTAGSAWLPRPANTNDLENALRLLLQLEPTSMSADKAAGYSVHGLRSYYITALTQMRARRSDRERVGRWKANSEMPDKYDSIAGTAELLTRKRVADAVSSGWRLALPNQLPMTVPRPKKLRFLKPVKQVAAESQQAAVAEEPPPLQPAPCAVETVEWSVAHSKTGLSHVWASGEKSLSRKFTSGTPEGPTRFAVFTKGRFSGMDLCDVCRRRADA